MVKFREKISANCKAEIQKISSNVKFQGYRPHHALLIVAPLNSKLEIGNLLCIEWVGRCASKLKMHPIFSQQSLKWKALSSGNDMVSMEVLITEKDTMEEMQTLQDSWTLKLRGDMHPKSKITCIAEREDLITIKHITFEFKEDVAKWASENFETI